VASRIRELRQLEKQLKALREQCTGIKEAAHCGILKGLTREGLATSNSSANVHVPGTHRLGHRANGAASND
jgi:hypothetical protein